MLKPWLTMQAELLLGGFHAELVDADDGSPELIISRWSQTRRFSDFEQASAWARQVLGDRDRPHQRLDGAANLNLAAQECGLPNLEAARERELGHSPGGE